MYQHWRSEDKPALCFCGHRQRYYEYYLGYALSLRRYEQFCLLCGKRYSLEDMIENYQRHKYAAKEAA